MGSGSAGRGPALRRAAIGAAAVTATLAAGIGAATAARGDGEGPASGVATAQLHDGAGAAVGSARFLARPGGSLRVTVDVHGLAPGFHGFHVHTTGVCAAPFTSAGGHHNPGTAGHGSHAGDLPPLLVMQDGTASMRFETDGLTLAGLLDGAGDGSALIIHAGRDNLANVPARYHSHVPDATSTTFGPDATSLATGDAGARAACGVVTR